MRKLSALTALLLCLALALSGCALRGPVSQSASEISLPEPPDEADNMILGESVSGASTEVTLYRVSPDYSGFSAVTQGIRAEVGESLPEAAVNALLADGNRAMADVKLLDCEFACGVATANLSIDARNATSDQELLALEASVCNTLLGVQGVRGANVLIADRSESCRSLPLGVQTAVIPSVTTAYAQLQAERDRMDRSDAAPIERVATLYFPTEDGRWLVPELRALSVTGGDFASALIEAMKAGPQDEACAIASIPEGAELMEGGPVIEILPTGERVLSLNFSSTLANYLAFSGLEVWELAGAVTLTMTSFLPELDAVRIMMNGEPITMCAVGEVILQFSDGCTCWTRATG